MQKSLDAGFYPCAGSETGRGPDSRLQITVVLLMPFATGFEPYDE